MSVPNQLSDQLLQLKNDQEIQEIIKSQDESLLVYKDTQQKLEAFNKFSQARYHNIHKHFELHTKLLKEVKGDLNDVFVKLRRIKKQLAVKYPDEMNQVAKKYPQPEVEDDD
ncbi:hypothetical protein INT46_008168 [Mucor plumbeus]|uniref:KxDL domain-containing protein n=1 Tax=Mucor plumbeus TaxID=97098 RepID=A0A8H7RQ49_9FUNG|nr:hypothetical protein INT46_008168 [Mucor plumbeus]